MITDEQIKNLKPGDPLIIHGTFDKIYEDGDIGIEVAVTGRYGEVGVIKDTQYFHPSCVSLPSVKPIEMRHTAKIPKESPKYDPCRKFRNRDKVRVKSEVNGRPVYIGEDAWEPLDPSEIWTVVEEKETGWVRLKNGCRYVDVWHGMLELVTPVEDLKPYSVTYDDKFYHIYKHGEAASIAVYSEARHPHAKASAEDECKRLTEEWLKTSNLN